MLKTISINTILIFFLLILIPSCGDDPAELMEPVDVTSYIYETVSNLISSNAMILNDDSFDPSYNSLTNYISIMTYYYLQTNWGIRKMQLHYTNLGMKADNVWFKQIEEQGIDTYFTVSYNEDRSPHYTAEIGTWGTYDGVYRSIVYQINYSGDGTGNFLSKIVDSISSNNVVTNKTVISNYANWEVISTTQFKFNLNLTKVYLTNGTTTYLRTNDNTLISVAINGFTNTDTFFSSLDSARATKTANFSFAVTNVDRTLTSTNYITNYYRTFINTFP